jgi:translation initiation factor IF-1
MTPAKELSGFIVEILPHEKYKPHLNDDEKVNARLEKKKKKILTFLTT